MNVNVEVPPPKPGTSRTWTELSCIPEVEAAGDGHWEQWPGIEDSDSESSGLSIRLFVG